MVCEYTVMGCSFLYEKGAVSFIVMDTGFMGGIEVPDQCFEGET